jgi:hypothetical protein
MQAVRRWHGQETVPQRPSAIVSGSIRDRPIWGLYDDEK